MPSLASVQSIGRRCIGSRVIRGPDHFWLTCICWAVEPLAYDGHLGPVMMLANVQALGGTGRPPLHWLSCGARAVTSMANV